MNFEQMKYRNSGHSDIEQKVFQIAPHPISLPQSVVFKIILITITGPTVSQILYRFFYLAEMHRI